MPYNPMMAMTNAQQRNQGVRGALEDFLGFFKAKKAAQDEAEKEGMQKDIATSSTQPDQSRHLAEVKAMYANKYGTEPASPEDFMTKDAMQKEGLAKIGDSQQAREVAKRGQANLQAFTSQVGQDAALNPTEKAFYSMDPKAYGDRLKPASLTYLPTDQGFIGMPTKAGPGGPAAPTGPLQLPGGATPKPFSKEPAPVKWTDKVDEQGNIIQTNPVTGEVRQTGAKAPTKPGAVTTSPSDLVDKAQQGMDLIDQMIGNKEKGTKPHPGFSSAVGAKGASSAFGLLKSPLAGTDAADFQALADQISGQAFLDARQQLKGGGAITDFEGKKAEGAITRMKSSQSEAGFIQAAKEYRTILQTAKARAEAKAKASPGQPAALGNADPLGLGL